MTGHMRSAALATCAALALAATGQAEPKWTALGPSGGRIVDVLVAPPQSRVAYAISDSTPAALFRTDDAGDSWRLASLGEFRGLNAIDPLQPKHLVAHGPTGLIASTDGGVTFSSIDPGIDPDYTGAAIFLPGPGRILLVAAPGGVYRSADGGAHWELSGFAGRDPSSITVSPHDTRLRFAREDDDGRPHCVGGCFALGSLLRSTDGGRTWSESGWAASRPYYKAGAFAWDGPYFDPTDPALAYLLAAGLFVSHDRGATWTQASVGGEIERLRVSPVDGRLIASGPEGMFVSHDHGSSWSHLPEHGRSGPPDSTLVVALSTTQADVAFVGGARGLWRTSDGGETWKASSLGIHRLYSNSVAVSADGATIYANVPGEGVFGGRAGGTLWRRNNRGLALDRASDFATHSILATDSEHAERVWRINRHGIYRSDDRAANWRQVSTPSYGPTGGGFALAGDRLMIGSGPVALTEDGGATWQLLDIPFAPISSLAFDSGNPDRLYATTRRGLLRSADRGHTWAALGDGLPHLPGGSSPGIWSHPSRSGEIYLLASQYGLYRSRDAGSTFERLTTGPPGDQLIIDVVRVDPSSPEDLFALTPVRDGLAGDTVLRYSDTEHRFLTVPTRGAPAHVQSLATDPSSPGSLLVSSFEGIFRLDSSDE